MTEAEIQTALFNQIRYRGHHGLWAWHTLNLPKWRGNAIRSGILPGVADVILVYGGKSHALELKTEVGKPTAAQLRYLEGMAENGWQTAVTHGLDAAITKIESWGLIR